VAVIKLNPEHRIGKGFRYHSFCLDQFFFSHTLKLIQGFFGQTA